MWVQAHVDQAHMGPGPGGFGEGICGSGEGTCGSGEGTCGFGKGTCGCGEGTYGFGQGTPLLADFEKVQNHDYDYDYDLFWPTLTSCKIMIIGKFGKVEGKQQFQDFSQHSQS